MKRARLFRGLIATALTVTGYSGLHGCGYTDGVDTTIGLDAGLTRDIATALIACAVGFFPSAQRFRGWWRKFTNADRVAALEDQIAVLEQHIAKAKRKGA